MCTVSGCRLEYHESRGRERQHATASKDLDRTPRQAPLPAAGAESAFLRLHAGGEP